MVRLCRTVLLGTDKSLDNNFKACFADRYHLCVSHLYKTKLNHIVGLYDMVNRLIFQHIPKVAGTSLASLFVDQFDRSHVFICGSEDGVLNDFLDLKQNARNRFELLIGHVDYGIHNYFDDDSLYITFLRDPIDRVISHYYFIKYNKLHRFHKEANRIDICEFIKSGIRPRMNNCMTRMISGISPEYNCCHEEMIDRALENIESHYIFFGFLSRLKESVALLIKKMGWDDVNIPHLNVTSNKPSKVDFTDKTLEIIMKYNQLDMKLYNLLNRI